MIILVIISTLVFFSILPIGVKAQTAYRKSRIEKRAKSLGYNLTFD